ncbi:hypothetical protein AB205_0113250 [Aquarana catesbeiana]|uniref:Intercellular adhesion molecule 1/3/5 D2 domain-containing protein n=1 Tax=Aquarana catesbeiana TaxID=8400 RepID=A0A2G9S4Y7_AQUCT|nr:hypothetical protein AB205_0113250 [Aquarana catesbeiana]
MTYALPEDPRITAETWVEKGTETSVSCEVPRAFPPDNITTVLSVEGYPNTSVTGNVFVSFSLDTNVLPAARHNLVCVSQVFSASKESKKHIYIYGKYMFLTILYMLSTLFFFKKKTQFVFFNCECVLLPSCYLKP